MANITLMFQVLLCPCEYKTCGWQVKLCDPIKHGALLERFEDLYVKCAIQVLVLHYITTQLTKIKFLPCETR